MMRPRHRVVYTLFILDMARVATAALSLGDLQPITGFAAQCQSAYNAPIPACPDAASFMDAGSTAGCDKTCFVALNDASVAIQQACQTAAAYGDTVISHAFKGDLSIFLCGSQFSDGSNSVTATNVGITHTIPITKSRPTISSSSASPSSTFPTAMDTSSDSSSPSSTASTAPSSSSSPVSSTNTVDSTTVSTTSVQLTTITTFSKTPIPSSTTTSPKTSTTPFDSTPFDLPSGSAAASIIKLRTTNLLLSLTSSISILGLTWLLSS